MLVLFGENATVVSAVLRWHYACDFIPLPTYVLSVFASLTLVIEVCTRVMTQ